MGCDAVRPSVLEVAANDAIASQGFSRIAKRGHAGRMRAVAGDGRERFDLILLRERIAVLRAEERFAGTTLRAMRETRGGVCTL